MTSHRIIKGWMDLLVVDIKQETHDTRTLYFVNQKEKVRAFDYIAGQYLTFRFDDLAPKPLVRSYTMSSSPSQPEFIAVTVKEIPSGCVSRYLCHDVKVGDVLRARGAIGKFCYFPETDKRHLVMVAGGSGVTPFVSILREYAPHLGEKNKAPDSMTLVVSFRTENDLICWDDLKPLREKCKILVTLTQQQTSQENFFSGRVDAQFLERHLTNLENSTFMTCGPDLLMKTTVDFLNSKSVHLSQIKTESFD